MLWDTSCGEAAFGRFEKGDSIFMRNRREFVKTLSSAALAPLAFSQVRLPGLRAAEAKGSRIPLAFSTLGCPKWEWDKILRFASEHGFAAIELRGLQGNLDLPANPLFAADRIEQTKKEIRASNLKIACVSSSAQMYVEDAAKREKELADGRRFIDLAQVLGAPYVRVFGGKAGCGRRRSRPPGVTRPQQFAPDLAEHPFQRFGQGYEILDNLAAGLGLRQHLLAKRRHLE